MLFEVMYTNITKKEGKIDLLFPYLFERNSFYVDLLVQEGRGRFDKLLFRFCGVKQTTAVLGTFSIHLRMSAQVVLQTFGYIFSLCDNADMLRSVFLYLREQDRIMRTAPESSCQFQDLWIATGQCISG